MRPKIVAITASAGAGKTTRIVRDIAGEVAVRDPERIVATTFTVKAADELIERARAALFSAGQADQAVRLLGARFGTVNSVCARIVAEHSFELSRSPRAQVIAEDSVDRILRVAASEVFAVHAEVLNGIAERFGYFEPWHGKAPDWGQTVQRVIDLARANGLGPDALEASADKSVASFLALLATPQAGETAEAYDDALRRSLSVALKKRPAELGGDSKKAIEEFEKAAAKLARGEAPSWPEWAKLAKSKATKRDGSEFSAAVAKVAAAAAMHPRHPRLKADCEKFVRVLFTCAAQSMTAYTDYKAARGLTDFTDQETLAHSVLVDPVARTRLSERLGLVFVDEFQDSSPLQVAIFTALADIVDQSTWVGDPKQAIYGFRNADTVLTQAAFLGASKGTAPGDSLLKSYRSRPAIVEFVNAAFEPALTKMGLPPADHLFSGTKRIEDGFKKPALGVWRLPGTIETQFVALAAKVRDTLAAATEWLVEPRDGGSKRPLALRDIAVLCRTKSDVDAVAAAMAGAGLAVAVERDVLGATPHIELVLAATRYVADRSDSLALAEIIRFFSDDPKSDAWLRAAGAENMVEALRAVNPIAADLENLREHALELTPAETIDAVMMLPALRARIEGWGEYASRLDDLEALRGFARAYQSECAGSDTPATLPGLLLSFEESAAKRPKSFAPDAIQVMTYHAAKGLEWSMVILTGLAKEPRPRLYEPVAEVEGDLEWTKPLAGRWIRYWPWPYGQQSKDVGLDATGVEAPLGKLAVERAREEETRLLYVGLTRARDYAILAPPAKGAAAWLRVLDAGAPEADHVRLPAVAGQPILAGKKELSADFADLKEVEPESVVSTKATTYVAAPYDIVERAPLFKRPSGATDGRTFVAGQRHALGHRIPIVGSVDMNAVGQAVHAVLAADRVDADKAKRIELARAVLTRWGVGQIDAEAILGAGDALNRFIAESWPAAKIFREIPVSALIENRLVNGRIDLLVDHADGFAIVDHKSFPGARDELDARAVGYGPQLAIYAEAVTAATRKRVTGMFVYFPILGEAIEIRRG